MLAKRFCIGRGCFSHQVASGAIVEVFVESLLQFVVGLLCLGWTVIVSTFSTGSNVENAFRAR